MSDKEVTKDTGESPQEPTPAEKAPSVFISYSHDSDAHSAWVLKFAEKLVGAGVDVVLDQWDLGPGDDVLKFMRHSVASADRVLMVCTAAYVRKADEGKGGVGYEAMVVDGELVRDQGTNKFIPVVRQDGAEPIIPKSVSTRLYVNFSEGQNEVAAFEKLIREIHQTPKVQKPVMGKNPFPASTMVTTHVEVTEVKIEDAGSAYDAALAIAQRGDLVGWRRLVREVKAPLSSRLLDWRKSYEPATSMQVSALPAMILEAATIYSPLMAVALAGVASGNPKFNNQVAMLDEFLRPREWNTAGLVVLGRVPESLVFTYQALHGAMCLELGETTLAVALSRARVARAHEFSGVVLHTDRNFVGMPESFAHAFREAWKFIQSLSGEWPWLETLFGSGSDYQSSLGAYYMALSVQELAVALAEKRTGILEQENYVPGIPVIWMFATLEIQQKVYTRFLTSQDQVREIWRSLGVSDKAMAEAWPQWVRQARRWVDRVTDYSTHGDPIHTPLFEDIRPREQ